MPLIENAWYVAARLSELDTTIVARTIVKKPIVIFKTAEGKISALLDACPHRAVPLHLGHVTGDRIKCPYHGLEFDGQGICRHNPHIKGKPEAISVKAFPVKIRDNLVWVWPGDAALAADSLIPDYSLFNAPDKYATCGGYTKVTADYRLIIDNLLDLTHAEYLHANTVGTIGASAVARHELERGKDNVVSKYLVADMPPSPVFKPIWTTTPTVDQYSYMNWRAVGNLFLDLSITKPGAAREDGLHFPSAHILTPETESTTHYFWTFARNFDLYNDELSQIIRVTGEQAFGKEDKPMIEAAQYMLETTGAQLSNFTGGDAASHHVRHVLGTLEAQKAA